jgi:3-oxoadipate CoA-transferase beta subunit
MNTAKTLPGIDRDARAAVVAADIPAGSFVNLGIGLPTKVSNYLTPDAGIMLHTENGMLGMGPKHAATNSSQRFSSQQFSP